MENVNVWLIKWSKLIVPPPGLKTYLENGKVRVNFRCFTNVTDKLKAAK